MDNGIKVDALCRTSDPDIFAAGDVTNHPNGLLGRNIRLESWENAQNQGIAAAKAMLGGETPYCEIPWFWSDQYDVNIQLVGLPADFEETVTRGDRADGSFVEFYMKGGRIDGARRSITRATFASPSGSCRRRRSSIRPRSPIRPLSSRRCSGADRRPSIPNNDNGRRLT